MGKLPPKEEAVGVVAAGVMGRLIRFCYTPCNICKSPRPLVIQLIGLIFSYAHSAPLVIQ
jgi:hypothetical protein